MGTEGANGSSPGGHGQWSGSMGLRTVECLRGRLLAERAASDAARKQEEQLSRRMDELERLLAVEIELRNKAVQRLERILRRLQSAKRLGITSQAPETAASVLCARFPSRGDPEQRKIHVQTNSSQLEMDEKGKVTADLSDWRKSSGSEYSETGRPGPGDPSIPSKENQASEPECSGREEVIPGQKQRKEVGDCPRFVGNGELGADATTARYVCCH